MTPTFICYHTPGPYAREAAELAVTCRQFDVRLDVVEVPAAASWVRACAHKPAFIRQMMLKYEGEPLVYVDADARVRKPPTLFGDFGPEVDLAVHYLDGSELLSGTIYVGGSHRAWDLVRLWNEQCVKYPDVWDQKTLSRVIGEHPGQFNIEHLPEAACYIFDRGTVPAESVIVEHQQASRRFR